MEGGLMSPLNKNNSSITQTFLTHLKGAIFDNLGLKLFSLLITLLLWLFVLGQEDVTTTSDVKVYFKVPADKVLVSDVPNRIRVTVVGPWAAQQSWNADNIEIGIDLSKFDLGVSVVYFEEQLFQIPHSLKITRINPKQWTVSLAQKTSKEVPITPVVVGNLPKGYVVKSITTSPEKMEIEGAASDLMIVDEVLTEEISLENHKENFMTTTNPVRLSKNIFYKNEQPINVTVAIKKDLIERTFDNVQVQVKNSQYVTQVDPPTIAVTVMGPKASVLALSEKDVTAFVDATKEEGDNPNTQTVREVEFEPLPDPLKIKISSFTVKLIIHTTKLQLPEEQENPVE